MKIRITISPSICQTDGIVTPEQLGFTESEWSALSDAEQQRAVDKYVSTLDDPYWKLDSFATIN